MASRSLNKVTLIGNLTRDPEVKYTPTGAAVCTFGIATNRSWTTTDGQVKEDVQYHRIVAWNKLAELCGKILGKGKKVFVEGRLSYRSYTAKDGTQKSITEIILDDFIVFSDGKRPEAESQSTSGKEPQTPPAEEAPHAPEPEADESVNPEDIPF